MGKLVELDEAVKLYLEEFWQLSGQEGLSELERLDRLERFRAEEEAFWELPVEDLAEICSELSTLGFPIDDFYEHHETKLELEVLCVRLEVEEFKAWRDFVRPYMEANPGMTFREALVLLERDERR